MNSKEYDGFSDSFRDSKPENATHANTVGAGVNSAGTTSSSSNTAPKAPSFGGAGQTSDRVNSPIAHNAKAEPATPPTNSRSSQTRRNSKTAPSTAPQSEQHATQPAPKSRMAVVWASLFVGVILMILLLVFIIQNNVSTKFDYFTWQFSLPLGVAMLLAALAGALIRALVGSVRMIQMRWELHKYRRDRK